MELSKKGVSHSRRKEIDKQKYQQSLKNYYADPNYCEHCGKLIHPRTGQKSAISATKRKKFCNHTCASSRNNAIYPRRTAVKEGICERCGVVVEFKKQKSGNYLRKRFCPTCVPLHLSELATERRNTVGFRNSGKPLDNYTKGELRKNTRYCDFRKIFSTYARNTYLRSGKPLVCSHCGYSYHVDICHIKDVAKFSDDALFGEINDLSNLVALCKNHHKEFDDGVLDLEGIVNDKKS